MPEGRLELPWIAPLVPKTSASTNFATPARVLFFKFENVVPEAGIFHYMNSMAFLFFQIIIFKNIGEALRSPHKNQEIDFLLPPKKNFKFFLLCPGRESNPHPLRDTILSRARIPIPPPGQGLDDFYTNIFNPFLSFILQSFIVDKSL